MSSKDLRSNSQFLEYDAKKPPQDEKEENKHHFQMGCGIMAKYPIVSLLTFVAMGIGLGVGLSFWNPEDESSKETAVQWIGLLGDLFLRALKAIVLPLVFVNVTIACVEMMMIGAAGGIGGRAIILYAATTLIAATMGSILAAIFSRWFHVFDNSDDTDHFHRFVSLGCNDENSFLAENSDGSISCTADWTDENDILWEVSSADGTLVVADSSETIDQVPLSQQFYDGIFLKLIPDNVFEVFVDANFAAIVVFAIAVGVAVAKLGQRMKTNPRNTTFMTFLTETDHILTIMIGWVIILTPFAVFSMIAASIGIVDDLGTAFANVGLLVACTFCGFILHYLFTYCGGLLLLARINPIFYLRNIVPAQLVAFATASSAATIPVNIESTVGGGVPETIAKFLVPLGATINMDGAALYFPCACIWLAVYNGITPTIGDYVLLAILSSFGSMGAAPVPNAGIVMIATAYQTTFNTTEDPLGFSFLFAIDWLVDRFATALNVTGDATVAKIVSIKCPLEEDGMSTDVEGSYDESSEGNEED